MKNKITWKLLVKFAKTNRKYIQQSLGEFLMLTAVFLGSFFYLKTLSTTTLVSSNLCHPPMCSKCDPLIALNELKVPGYFAVNIQFTSSDGSFVTTYTEFEANWQNCAITDPDTFTSLWAYNTSLSHPNSTQVLYVGPVKNHGSNNTYPPADCFTLDCSVHTYNTTAADAPTMVAPYNGGHGIRLVGSINGEAGKNSIVAACSADINGLLLPYFTATNFVQTSLVSQCTSHLNNFSAISQSLSYSLTLMSIIKLLHYFHGLLKKMQFEPRGSFAVSRV